MTARTTIAAPDAPAQGPASGLAELAPVAHLIGSTAIDGIPVLFAPRANEQDGQRTAGLFFRVGSADETLATSGITHLVEHLALHGRELSEGHHNGVTSESYTLFHVEGTDEEVVTYLNGVCAALADLPTGRLGVERQILQTEAQRRSGGFGRTLRRWRYGAQSYGLSGFDEPGLLRLDADDVRQWAQTYFTRDNAVLFVMGATVPDGLDLILPRGARSAPPSPSNALPQTPAFFYGDDGIVLLDAVVERSPAATVFAQVAGRALFHDLRQEGGHSYAPSADYSRRDATHAVLTLHADALPDQQAAVVGGIVDTVARLRLGTIEQAEVDAARSPLLRRFDSPDLAAEMLAYYALDLLFECEVTAPDALRAGLEAVTVEDVQQVANDVWADALLQVPGNAGAEWAGTVPAPQWSTEVVDGVRYPRIDNPEVVLVIGPDGASLTAPGQAVTVRFEDCVLMSTRPDGARYLIGADGFHVAVEPTLYAGLEAVAVPHALDARVPTHLVVDLGPRDPQEIPQPRTAMVGEGERTGFGGWVDRRVDQVLDTARYGSLVILGIGLLSVLQTEFDGAALLALVLVWGVVQAAVGVAWWRIDRRRRELLALRRL